MGRSQPKGILLLHVVLLALRQCRGQGLSQLAHHGGTPRFASTILGAGEMERQAAGAQNRQQSRDSRDKYGRRARRRFGTIQAPSRNCIRVRVPARPGGNRRRAKRKELSASGKHPGRTGRLQAPTECNSTLRELRGGPYSSSHCQRLQCRSTVSCRLFSFFLPSLEASRGSAFRSPIRKERSIFGRPIPSASAVVRRRDRGSCARIYSSCRSRVFPSG